MRAGAKVGASAGRGKKVCISPPANTVMYTVDLIFCIFKLSQKIGDSAKRKKHALYRFDSP